MRPVAVMFVLVVALFALIVGGSILFRVQWSASGATNRMRTRSRPAPTVWARGFWLVKAIDATVGLPERTRPYDDHAALAGQFLSSIEAGEAEAAYGTLSADFQMGSSAHVLQQTWTVAIKRLGAPDAIVGERRWFSVSGGPTGDEEPVYTIAFVRNHTGCSTKSKVGVRRFADRLVVVSYEIQQRPYRVEPR